MWSDSSWNGAVAVVVVVVVDDDGESSSERRRRIESLPMVAVVEKEKYNRRYPRSLLGHLHTYGRRHSLPSGPPFQHPCEHRRHHHHHPGQHDGDPCVVFS